MKKILLLILMVVGVYSLSVAGVGAHMAEESFDSQPATVLPAGDRQEMQNLMFQMMGDGSLTDDEAAEMISWMSDHHNGFSQLDGGNFSGGSAMPMMNGWGLSGGWVSWLGLVTMAAWLVAGVLLALLLIKRLSKSTKDE